MGWDATGPLAPTLIISHNHPPSRTLHTVHERQALGDFLLIVLRDLLAKRPALRLVLMSATVNQELFCRYMGGCPAFSIPGRFFPVEELYLEDVLEVTRHFIEEGSPYARRDMRAQYKSATVEVTGRGGSSYAQRLEWQEEAAEAEGRRGPEWAAFMEQCREGGYGTTTLKSLGRVDESVLNPELVEDLLRHIVESEAEHVARGDPGWREDGAVLVFLPGLGEIRSVVDRLQGGRLFRDERRFSLLPLHSSLSSAEQQRVFQRPPRGVRKVILSTNIAETSVTIDDVAYVVDCGLVREVHLANRGRGGGRALLTTWCSRASAKQRMGRAGRVAPGVCFRLFSRHTHDRVMAEFAVPELQRTPLEELCLSVRANDLAPSCRAFLSKAPEAPDPVAVDAAVRALQEVGALARPEGAGAGPGPEEEGELTPLGVHLSKLPVDVRIGKVGGWVDGCMAGLWALLFRVVLACMHADDLSYRTAAQTHISSNTPSTDACASVLVPLSRSGADDRGRPQRDQVAVHGALRQGAGGKGRPREV